MDLILIVPAGVGVHRADVDLVAVALGRGPVVADRHRQEVVHEVGVGHVLVGADEAAALEVVGGPGPAAAQQPRRAHPRAVAPLQRRRHRHRLLGAVLDVDLEVVLEVLADRRHVLHHVDAERLQLRGPPHARELEQLG